MSISDSSFIWTSSPFIYSQCWTNLQAGVKQVLGEVHLFCVYFVTTYATSSIFCERYIFFLTFVCKLSICSSVQVGPPPTSSYCPCLERGTAVCMGCVFWKCFWHSITRHWNWNLFTFFMLHNSWSLWHI